jgi:riboflavin-specific deaminase-like protein
MKVEMDRPFVCTNVAMTADGKISSTWRQAQKFSSRYDKKMMDRVARRCRCDSRRRENAGDRRPAASRTRSRDASLRRSLGKPDALVNVVVTASASIDPAGKFFNVGQASDRIIATVEDADASRVESLAKVAEVWRIGKGKIDLRTLLSRLRSRGIERLIVEGGGDTIWGFVRDDLVDELYITICPALLGGQNAPTPCEGEGLMMADQRRLKLVSSDVVDGRSTAVTR